jgi:hypothetical protein
MIGAIHLWRESMRRITRAAVLLALLLPTLRVVGADDPKPEDVGVTLIGVGNMEKELVMDVAEHLLVNLMVPVHVRHLDVPVSDPEVLRKQVEAKREKGDLCVVALVKAPANWHRDQVFAEAATALLIPDAMVPLEKSSQKDKERRWRLRIKKESIRAVASMVSMPACPFPRCALLNHLNDRQLDAKGYNPCPPCQSKLEKSMMSAGAVVRPRR